MASTQTWSEFNGPSGTETTSRTEANWKRVDDSTTPYTSSPINSTNNESSMEKIQAVKFDGTWNTLSAATYKIDDNAPATGLAIKGAVVTSYTQPSTTANADPSLSTSGVSAGFGTSSTPFSVAGGASVSGGGTMYANALRSQLQTTSSYAGGPGAIATRTITYTWTES